VGKDARPRAHLQLGNTLLFMGQPEAGIPHIEKTIRLNPYDPNSATLYLILGLCRLYLGQLGEAINLLRKARAGNPRLPVPAIMRLDRRVEHLGQHRLETPEE
jgi:tetratricopeptide (TPR) repeat protein